MAIAFIFVVVNLAMLTSCSGQDRFAAEVGHRENGKVIWELWGYFLVDECNAVAQNKYKKYESQGNAHVWACWKRQKDGSVPLAFSNQGEKS